jgi:hypothetical protein
MHVRQFRSATYALLGDYSEEGDEFPGQDPPRTYVVGAELYPTPTLGVRLGYERFDTAGSEVNTASIGASWFVGPRVGLELTLSRQQTEYVQPFLDEPPDTDRAALRVIGRL